jgi:hypothetical protein
MNEKVHMPKDKWFGLKQKTKDLWDQIDDNDKSAILGYTNEFWSSKETFKIGIQCNIPAIDQL